MKSSSERIYESLDIREINTLKELLNRVIASHDKTILIVGECEIKYSGRASSYAEKNNRLIIIKPDGTLLIHESEGRDPLNWQPPGSQCIFYIEENRLSLKCIRSRPKEIIEVSFGEIFHIGLASIGRTIYFEVKGVEKDLVEIISRKGLPIDPEARLVGREISTPHGKIDLVFRNIFNKKLYVVEVKNEKAGVVAVDQLKRYVDYIKTYSREEEIVGVLVARGIGDEAMRILLKEGFVYLDADTFREILRSRKDLMSFLK
ncbi:MAG: endonuclease NucS domain-containing protein [Sulfolobales archaeon]